MRDWKACERRVAELLGGKRVPVSGRTRGDCPDIEHPSLSIECKSRKKLPAWIEDAMNQAEASARDGRLPVVVLHQNCAPYGESLVVLRPKDFVNYLERKTSGPDGEVASLVSGPSCCCSQDQSYEWNRSSL